MKRSLLLLSSSFVVAALCGCQESTPQVTHDRSVHRGTVPPGRLTTAAKKVTSRDRVAKLDSAANSETDQCGSSGGREEQTECADWHKDLERSNQNTGEFEYIYSCATGGDIATIRTVGVGDAEGNGHYTQTYAMRDGSEILWTYTYTLGADGISQDYVGSSSDGTQYTGTYRYLANDVTEMHEVYTMPGAGGISKVDGTTDAAERFTGTQSWDDPATPEDPDSRLVQTENDAGLRQNYTYIFEGWDVSYNAFYPAAGGLEYDWTSDDRATTASPDYRGAYVYASDNSGSGSYRQLFNDGSFLDVSHVVVADGSYTEHWEWHDATTPQDLDQKGDLAYTPCGPGTGTMTTYVQGGAPETCHVRVDLDGTTTVDQCN